MLERLTTLGAVFAIGVVAINVLPQQLPSADGNKGRVFESIRKRGQSGLIASAHAAGLREAGTPSEQEGGPAYLPPVAAPKPRPSYLRPVAQNEFDDAGYFHVAYHDISGPPHSLSMSDTLPSPPVEEREASDRSGFTADIMPVRFGGAELSGLATYYHPSLAGRRMSNGQPYDPSEMTAASNRWPLGTQLLVTYGDASVILEITDRGRFRHALDLSEGAFLALAGSTRPGVIRVSIQEETEPE